MVFWLNFKEARDTTHVSTSPEISIDAELQHLVDDLTR